MKHVTALLIKFVVLGLISYIALAGVPRTDGQSILWVALVLTIALYLVGDLIILPTLGNTAATVADAGVALLLYWMAPVYSGIDRVTFGTALFGAVLVAIAEYFLHRYLQRNVLPGPVTGSGTT